MTVTRTSGDYWIYRAICPHRVLRFPRGQRGPGFDAPAVGRSWAGTGVKVGRSAARAHLPSSLLQPWHLGLAVSPPPVVRLRASPQHYVGRTWAFVRDPRCLRGTSARRLCLLLFASRMLRELSTGLDPPGSPSPLLVGALGNFSDVGSSHACHSADLRLCCGFNIHLLMIKKLHPLLVKHEEDSQRVPLFNPFFFKYALPPL